MLILASQSPRRSALLGVLGLDSFKVIPSQLDESAQPKELPQKLVRRLAQEKAEKVFQETSQFGEKRVVLAADTLVSMGRRVVEAPHNEEEARACLRRLSGRSHCVHTSVAVISIGTGLRQKSVLTRVSFKVLSEEEIQSYTRSGEGLGKAGGYSIQGFAGSYVRRLNGSWSGVVGLPLLETRTLLMSAGVQVWPTIL